MGIPYNTAFMFLCLLSLTYNVNAQKRQVFDITKHGARDGGSDSGQALENAWKAACASAQPAEVLIPKGTFLVKNAFLAGPCKANTIKLNLVGTLKAPSDPSQQAKSESWITIDRVKGLRMNGGGWLDGNGHVCWEKKKNKQMGDGGFLAPTSLRLQKLTGAVIENFHSLNSKMFHIEVFGSNDVTVRSVTIQAPWDSPNTDGIHIGRSTLVKVERCTIKTGDDCVSIGDGGQQVTVTDVDCGPGHGIAVGSLGRYSYEEPVSGIHVKSCRLSNTENGLRIKTWRNSPKSYTVSDVHFEDIQMKDVTYPINIDQEYCPSGNCGKNQSPSKIKIDKLSFKGIKGTSSTSQIVKLLCSASNPCSNVEIGDIDISYHGRKGSDTSICSNVKPRLTGTQNPPLCTSKPQSS